ncbi:hypothetical protein FBU30_003139 [Linnemannia zychae]|nr:hypothetical protein FBU30_003139 [Linnemannia zychae]
MQHHPLIIPEILAAIGSFLPLWKPYHFQQPELGPFEFQPKTLLTCLQVSKLWQRTLLPILWYGYWWDSMEFIPKEVIRRYSHLFKVLYLFRWSSLQVDLSVFHCSNLVELDIFIKVDDDQLNIEEMDSESDGSLRLETAIEKSEKEPSRMPALYYAKQILRSSPQLKVLSWEGVGRILPVLEAHDFVGLNRLEKLSLDSLDCSNRQLDRTLRNIAGTLRELNIGWICGIEPELLSSSSPAGLQLSQDEEYNGTNSELRTEDDILVMGRLESLSWSGGEVNDEYLSKLLKYCPKLKKLELYVQDNTWDFDRLAASLGRYCPDIKSITIDPVIMTHKIETVIRCCSPGQSQLCKVQIGIEGPDEDQLILAVLEHASTLREFIIYRTQSYIQEDLYLHFLMKCSKLAHFALISRATPYDVDFFEMLKSQPWGCQDTLQTLEFDMGFRSDFQTAEEKQEVEILLLEMGWEFGDPGEGGGRRDHDDLVSFELDHLRQVLEVMQVQKLERVQRMALDEIWIRRIVV